MPPFQLSKWLPMISGARFEEYARLKPAMKLSYACFSHAAWFAGSPLTVRDWFIMTL